MKKRPSRLPVFFLFIFVMLVASSIALGVITVKPATQTIEQDVRLPITGSPS